MDDKFRRVEPGYPPDLADRLARARRNADLTLVELEAKIGISDSTLGRYEKGKLPRGPFLERLVELYAEACDVPEHWFRDDEVDTLPPPAPAKDRPALPEPARTDDEPPWVGRLETQIKEIRQLLAGEGDLTPSESLFELARQIRARPPGPEGPRPSSPTSERSGPNPEPRSSR